MAPPAPLLQKLLPYPALRTLAAHVMRFKRPPVKPQTALVKVCCLIYKRFMLIETGAVCLECECSI